jgi:hypothetical protein
MVSVVNFENIVSKWGKEALLAPPVFDGSTKVSCKMMLSINSSGGDVINGEVGKNGDADTERLNEPEFVLLLGTAAVANAVVGVSAAAAGSSREVVADDSSGDCKKSI